MSAPLTTRSTEISVLELRRLLYQLKDLRPDNCIRVRLMGEMWKTDYQRIIKLTETGVILNDEASNKLIIIPDLKVIMQLELEFPFQQYQPNFHYSVTVDEKE